MGLLAGAEDIAFLDDEVVEPDYLARAAAQGLSPPVELGPYPGCFLGEDLESEATTALRQHCPHREEDPAEEFVCVARKWAGKVGGEYFGFISRWSDWTEGV